MKYFSDYRKNYTKYSLLEDELVKDPFYLFKIWLKMAEDDDKIDEPNAFTLSTVNKKNEPRNRVVLMKKLKQNGIVFFTNYDSKKGESIKKNKNVCLSFFWPSTERQVIIQGVVEKVDDETATEYYHSRPRGSQLGAWASPQSSEIASREVLENNLAQVELKYKDHEVPKPENWGGYIVKPVNIEFWQGRQNRLHDRIIFNKEEAQWNSKRLAP